VAKASFLSSFAAQKMPPVRKISFYKPKNYRYGGLIVDKKRIKKICHIGRNV
jgi:hypothetical protein